MSIKNVQSISPSLRSLSGPSEIAKVIDQASLMESHNVVSNASAGTVYLEIANNMVILRAIRDQYHLTPETLSSKPELLSPIDILFIEAIEKHMIWNEHREYWQSRHDANFDVIFSAVALFPSIKDNKTLTDLTISEQKLDAKVLINWQKAGAYFELVWNEKEERVPHTLLGTPPQWAIIDNVITRVAPLASHLCTLFTRSSKLFVSFSGLSPILELFPFEPQVVEEKNTSLRPKIKYVPAVPVLSLQYIESPEKHNLEGPALSARLEYHHAADDPEKGLIHIPEQWDSGETESILKRLGFSATRKTGDYVISGEDTLNLLDAGRNKFPSQWQVENFDDIRERVKFAELSIDIALTKAFTDSSHHDFSCDLALMQNNARVPFSSLFKNTKSRSLKWVKLDSGAFAKIPCGGLPQLRSTLGAIDANFSMSNTISVPISSAQAVGIASLEDENLVLNYDRESSELINKVRDFRQIKMITPSPKFQGTLREYQEMGLSWLKFLYDFRFGGILADEMGLGKTVQMLAFLDYLVTEGKGKRTPNLIVCPTSVVTNWLHESKRFCPHLKVLLLHGPGRKEHFLDLESYDLVLTTYPLVRIDRHQLKRIHWHHIIVDEAQYIKNPTASTTRALKALNSSYRIALTGTPTENRPMELWSIVDFLMPGYLGTKEFFYRNMEKKILEGSEEQEAVTQLLQLKVQPFILRRKKSEVEKDLPPRIESTHYVEMGNAQRKMYDSILSEIRSEVFQLVEDKGIGKSQMSILAALTKLRQICNHPASLRGMAEEPDLDSGKYRLFQSLTMEALENGRKILVFSQFVQMLGIMKDWLNSSGIEYQYLDGRSKDRQDIINDFNESESVRVFLISLKAGGTGLNLTSADTVILYDPWWNPAVENQAVDRAHRIGQTKAVNVYRLVTENSIEEHIMKLKESKDMLFESIVGRAGARSLSLTREDLEHLFSSPDEIIVEDIE